MPTPQCSVIIPAYNAIEYLPAAIASVLIQQTDNIEILVCDDGSSDGTREWLAHASRLDRRIRVFEGNRFGPARARNYLIENANSDLVAFLDADDTWLAGKLSAEIDFHANNRDVAFTFTDYRHVDMAGNLRSTCFGYWKPRWAKPDQDGFKVLDDAFNELLATNVVGTSCVVAKREFLRNANGFAEELPSAEDWDLWLKLAALGKVASSNAVTMHYLMRPGSETSNRAARISAMKTVLAQSGAAGAAGWAKRHARARIFSSKAQSRHETGQRSMACLFGWIAFLNRPDNRMLREALAFTKYFAMLPLSWYSSRPAGSN